MVLFALNWQVNAQREEFSLQNRNEVKLDVAYLLGLTLKVEYERLLNDWSSVGVVVLQNFSSGPQQFGTQVLGFYRLYFGRQPVSGFFLEGNLGITHGYDGHYYWIGGWRPRESYTAFGLGLALGWKWYIPRSGIVLDIFVGGGRLVRENNDRANYDRVMGYPRVGITIGRRF